MKKAKINKIALPITLVIAMGFFLSIETGYTEEESRRALSAPQNEKVMP